MTVTVTMDQASARLVNFDYCPDTLSADGTITLELPDAMVADRRPVTLSASADSVPTRVTFGLDEKDFGPWLSVTKADPQSSLRMTVGVTAPERGCSGDIQLIWTQVRGNVGAAAGRPLATWSDTGCGTGQSAVPLDQAWQGIDLVRAVVTTFGHVDVPGTWRDGSATTLSLVTSMLGNVGCAEPAANGFSVVTIPVDVAASTADGRVRGLVGKGSIRAEVSGGALWQLQLALRSASVCASQGDSLPYTPASCVTGRRATGQLNLGVNRSDAARSWGSLDFNLWQGNTSEGWDGLTLQP